MIMMSQVKSIAKAIHVPNRPQQIFNIAPKKTDRLKIDLF